MVNRSRSSLFDTTATAASPAGAGRWTFVGSRRAFFLARRFQVRRKTASMSATAGPSTWTAASRQSPPPSERPTHSFEMFSPPANATLPSHTRVLRWLRRMSAQNRGRQNR